MCDVKCEMWNEKLKMNNEKKFIVHYSLFLVVALFLAVSAFADSCRITSIVWMGERESYEESQVQTLMGKSCESWPITRDRIVRYYENAGFLAAHLEGSVDSSGVLSLGVGRS